MSVFKVVLISRISLWVRTLKPVPHNVTSYLVSKSWGHTVKKRELSEFKQIFV